MLILIAFRFDYKKAVNHSERVRLFRLASSCSAFRSRYFMWESGSRVEREFWNTTNARWKSRRICRVCDCDRTFSGQISRLNLFFFFSLSWHEINLTEPCQNVPKMYQMHKNMPNPRLYGWKIIPTFSCVTFFSFPFSLSHSLGFSSGTFYFQLIWARTSNTA